MLGQSASIACETYGGAKETVAGTFFWTGVLYDRGELCVLFSFNYWCDGLVDQCAAM